MRPQKLRLIAAKPACRRFSPDTGHDAPAMTLGLDMLEALRLADAEGLSQEEAARQMKISPPTFCRLLAEADAARQTSPGECVITSDTSSCIRCKKIAKAGQVPAFFVSPVVVWGMAGLACAGA